MHLRLALLACLIALPALAQQPPRRAAQTSQPALWSSTGANFAERFNAAARQHGIDVRAVAGACKTGAAQASCDIRVGSLPGTVMTRNGEPAIREVMIAVGGGSTSAAADALQAFTVLVRWAAPQADDGERRATFNAIFPAGNAPGQALEARLHGTKFSRVAMPGVGNFLFASPAE